MTVSSLISPLRVRTVIAAAALAFAAACSGGEGGGGSTADVDPYYGDVVMGDAAAPVELVEYASFTCSHCRDFWKQIFPRLKAEYIDTGKVKYVMRDWPTNPADLAIAGVGLSRCAGEDKYYDIVDELFSRQGDLFDAAQKGAAGPVLVEVGAAHGLSVDEVRACIDHPGIETHLTETQTQAAGRVRGTPAVFLNDEATADHGTWPALQAAIEAKLNPQAEAVAPVEGAEVPAQEAPAQ
jgi:protein-disulfide isomerase